MHPCHAPDTLTNSLVQRLEGQRVLGDRHQQWLPVEHCPGGSARWPGPPLPEVDGQQETLRAVRGGAADLVPVSITQGTHSGACPCEQHRSEMQLPDGPDYGYWDRAYFSTKGRKTIFETILEAAPKEGHYQRSVDLHSPGPGADVILLPPTTASNSVLLPLGLSTDGVCDLDHHPRHQGTQGAGPPSSSFVTEEFYF